MKNPNIIGGNGSKPRNERDFYPTPPECTIALLNFLKEYNTKPYKVWECACGEGHITKVLKEKGIKVVSTDIITGTDFLATDLPENDIDWIITNPPFNLAEEFIKHAHALRKKSDNDLYFAFLLKSQFWHSKKRYQLFEETNPSFVLPLTWRPNFTGQGSSLLDMLWTVWCFETTEYSGTVYQPLKKPIGEKI